MTFLRYTPLFPTYINRPRQARAKLGRGFGLRKAAIVAHASHPPGIVTEFESISNKLTPHLHLSHPF